MLLCLPAGVAVGWCEPATRLLLLLLLCTDKLEPCSRLRPEDWGGSLWSGTLRPHRGQVGFSGSHWGFFNPAASCEASADGAAAGRGWAGHKAKFSGGQLQLCLFFLTFLILIRVLFSGQVSRFPLTADEVSADGISSAKRVTCWKDFLPWF